MSHERVLDNDDYEAKMAGHGNIVYRNGNGKAVWWVMGIIGSIFVAVLVSEMAWLGSTVVDLSGKVAAMDAKLTLLLDGRIKDGRP